MLAKKKEEMKIILNANINFEQSITLGQILTNNKMTDCI